MIKIKTRSWKGAGSKCKIEFQINIFKRVRKYLNCISVFSGCIYSVYTLKQYLHSIKKVRG